MQDEAQVIAAIVDAAGRVRPGYSSIGDDVGVSPVQGRSLVTKVDMLVESTDVPRGMTYREAARKAVAMCVSDFAAKGVRPTSFMVSLGLRRGTTSKQVQEIGAGIRDAENEWGLVLVGGDTNESAELVIDCAMFGFASDLVKRGGAAPGDALVVSGPFGYESAGLRILLAGSKASRSFAKVATRRVLRPTPNLEAGLALAPFLTSSMDSSDGLARSLHVLASESGVGFELDALPEGNGVRAFAEANGLSAERLVLEGGEEYVIVGTVRPRNLRRAREAARVAGADLTLIGRATPQEGRVDLLSRGRRTRVRDEGWTHLRRG